MGSFVGEDEQGNRYYEERRPSIEGRKRRYVIYNGLAEASRVSPDWHGWMHHTVRRAADRRAAEAAEVGEAARAEPDRHGARVSAERLAGARRR